MGSPIAVDLLCRVNSYMNANPHIKARFFNEIYFTPKDFYDHYWSKYNDLLFDGVLVIDGMTIVEVYDNNMWNEMIVIDGEFENIEELCDEFAKRN